MNAHGLTALFALTAWLVAAPEPPAKQPAKNDSVQEFVFLGEAHPLLVRLNVQVDDQPLQAVWDGFLKHLFDYLDADGDGALSKKEAERAPTVEQLLSGGIGELGGGRSSPQPTMDTLDGDKDGKVTVAELSAYYHKNGFQPFQFQLNSNDTGRLAAAIYRSGSRPEPEVAAVSKAIFARLDADKDGKLTRDELAVAPEVLLALDDNDDEILTAQEIAPDARPRPATPGAAKAMMAGPQKSDSVGNNTLVPVATPGQAPAELARRMQERYGAGKEKKKLDRKALGLDEATFAHLDADKDGVLNDAELGGFVKRESDLGLTVRLGDKETPQTPLVVEGRPTPLAGVVQTRDGLVLLDLGATRVEIRQREEKRSRRFADFLRQQLVTQFKAADKDGDGCLDEKEAKASRPFPNLFKAADRNGDGKVSEKELLAYLDQAAEFQKRAMATCVSLVLRDQSRGLFDLLDTNRDGRLSVRELRQAPKLLAQLDHQDKGYLEAKDIPHSYQLTLRRGPSDSAGLGQEAVLIERYFGGYGEDEPASNRGPAWFRKMDRNRDGDVSRREFLFSDEQFRRIDTDGDGLISVEEAEKASVSLPKEKESR